MLWVDGKLMENRVMSLKGMQALKVVGMPDSS